MVLGFARIGAVLGMDVGPSLDHRSVFLPIALSFCYKNSWATKYPARQAIEPSRKGIGGRPRGVPTAVIRLPLPVAALARRLSQGTLRAGDINGFLDVRPGTRMRVPLVGVDAKCGFPSPAEDYLDNPLDHPAARCSEASNRATLLEPSLRMRV
jgi:hypothetical protein